MPVYVDDMYKSPMGQYGRMKMSHMIADTEEELHAMARRIGVARRWYQGDHYDIALSKRAIAVAAGAVEIGMRELAAMAMLARWGQDMGQPDTAVMRLREHKAKTRGMKSYE